MEVSISSCKKQVVGCKWVLTVKQKTDGAMEQYKARSVCKGIYSDVRHRLSRNLCSSGESELHSCPFIMCIKFRVVSSTAKCKECVPSWRLGGRVYMEPACFSSPTTEEVWPLKKAFYGLKQPPRARLGRFHKAMVKYGYRKQITQSLLNELKRKLLFSLFMWMTWW